MSIVRVGLSETKGFSDGYDAIFGKKKGNSKKEETAKAKGKAKASTSKKKGSKKK